MTPARRHRRNRLWSRLWYIVVDSSKETRRQVTENVKYTHLDERTRLARSNLTKLLPEDAGRKGEACPAIPGGLYMFGGVRNWAGMTARARTSSAPRLFASRDATSDRRRHCVAERQRVLFCSRLPSPYPPSSIVVHRRPPCPTLHHAGHFASYRLGRHSRKEQSSQDSSLGHSDGTLETHQRFGGGAVPSMSISRVYLQSCPRSTHTQSHNA